MSENLRKEFYGWVLTNDNKVYIVTYDNYKLQEVPTVPEDPQYSYVADDVTIYCYTYPISRHILISGDGFRQMIVTDMDFNKIAEHVETWTPYDKRISSRIKHFIFPFELTTYDPLKHVKVQMNCFWWEGLVGTAISLLALLLF